MKYILRQKFSKHLFKLPVKIQKAFWGRIEIFQRDIHHPLLNIHKLDGEYLGFFSINITGDYRAIFEVEQGIGFFYKIGTHDELYNK